MANLQSLIKQDTTKGLIDGKKPKQYIYIDGPKRELSVFFSCVLGGKLEAGGKRTKRS